MPRKVKICQLAVRLIYISVDNSCPLSTERLTDYHHKNIIELTIRYWVWKVGEGLPGRILPKTSKWVAVYSSVMFHING